MIKSLKCSGVRRLGLHATEAGPEHATTTAPSDQPVAVPQQQHTQPPAPQQHHRNSNTTARASSKALALSAFRSLVEGASYARPCTASEAVAAAQQQQQHGGGADAAAANNQPLPASAAAAAPSLPSAAAAAAATRSNKPPLFRASTTASLPPSQLLPKASKDLARLQQQLASRTLTYLYQLDGLLSTASGALGAVAAHLSGPLAHHSNSSSGAAAGPQQAQLLMQLVQPAAAQDPVGTHSSTAAAAATEAVLDQLLQLCVAAWEVEVLLLRHHHAAEPQNTIQQAGQFHTHARTIWQACEAHSSNTPDTTASTNSDTAPTAAVGEGAALTSELCTALSVLAEAASAWTAAKESDAADWCYQQLRRHLLAVAAAGGDAGLQLETRRALQRLQFSILAGNLCLAARQGLQGMWANLSNLVQQLLQHTVLEHEDTLAASLAMAGALADAASGLQTNSAGSSPSSIRDTASTAVMLLEFTAQLLTDAKQRAAALAHEQQQQHAEAEATEEQGALTLQVADIQQQVLLQLAQAYLSCSQPGRLLECISLVHGLSTGRTPPAGLLQLSSLALVQQGKLGAASAQLCAWLQQGGQSTEEACAAVRSFLVALHSNATASAAAAGAPANSASRRAAEDRAAAVQQVASAAAEHCRSDPSVALEVVLQLLVEQGSGSTQLSLERLAVQLLSIEEVSQLLHTRPDDCRKCHALLHHKGAAHYAAHRYPQAIELLTPAVFFATSLTAGRSARLLAAALLKSGQPGRALEYVGLAEQQEGAVTAPGCVIRLHASLQLRAQAQQAAANASATGATAAADAAAPQEDEAAAADAAVVLAVKDLAAAPELSSDTMQAALTLCLQHDHPAAAWHVLVAWRDAAGLPAATTTSAAAAGAAVDDTPVKLRGLQVLSLMQHIAAAASTSSSSNTNTCVSDPQLQRQWLCDMCETLTHCCGASGSSNSNSTSSCCFTGALQPKLMWLIETGIELGVAAAREDLLGWASTVLQSVLRACGWMQQQQQQGQPQPAAAALAGRCVAALCVAASLLLQAKPSGTSASAAAATQQQLQQAGELLRAAQQHLQQQQQDALAWADAAAVSAPLQPLQLLVLRLSFALAVRQGHDQQVKQQLQLLVQHPLTTSSDLQAAALECLQPGRRGAATAAGAAQVGYQAVAALAYSHMLRLEAAAVPADLPAVAEAVAGMLALVTSHAVKIKAVSKVVEVLAAAAAGSAASSGSVAPPKPYPAKSLQWLLASCWNAAVQADSSGDTTTAARYLQLVNALAASQQQQQQQQGEDQQHQQQHWLLASQKYQQLSARLQQQPPPPPQPQAGPAAAEEAAGGQYEEQQQHPAGGCSTADATAVAAAEVNPAAAQADCEAVTAAAVTPSQPRQQQSCSAGAAADSQDAVPAPTTSAERPATSPEQEQQVGPLPNSQEVQSGGVAAEDGATPTLAVPAAAAVAMPQTQDAAAGCLLPGAPDSADGLVGGATAEPEAAAAEQQDYEGLLCWATQPDACLLAAAVAAAAAAGRAANATQQAARCSYGDDGCCSPARPKLNLDLSDEDEEAED